MPIMNVAFWMLILLALAIAGVLTLLDEILSDTPHTEPVPTEHRPYGESELENSERRAGRESRT